MNKYMIKHFKKLNKGSEVWLGRGGLGGLDIVRTLGHFWSLKNVSYIKMG